MSVLTSLLICCIEEVNRKLTLTILNSFGRFISELFKNLMSLYPQQMIRTPHQEKRKESTGLEWILFAFEYIKIISDFQCSVQNFFEPRGMRYFKMLLLQSCLHL